jgi:hypothetical protein
VRERSTAWIEGGAIGERDDGGRRKSAAFHNYNAIKRELCNFMSL